MNRKLLCLFLLILVVIGMVMPVGAEELADLNFVAECDLVSVEFDDVEKSLVYCDVPEYVVGDVMAILLVEVLL